MALLLNSQQVRSQAYSGTLARMPLVGGAPREVLENVEWADWSPDGSQLAIVRDVGGRDRLEYPIGKVLYETGGWISHPRISRKGDSIAFLDHPVQGIPSPEFPSSILRARRQPLPSLTEAEPSASPGRLMAMRSGSPLFSWELIAHSTP